MMRLQARAIVLAAGACWLLAFGALGVQAAPPDHSRPNIVVILADDLGYGDVSCYGATKVKTPNIDRLAERGLRFTDAHSASAVCSPSRYALLTGEHAWRSSPARSILSGIAPLAVPLDRLTVPKLLKSAGYATGIVGKWHLGLGDPAPDFNAEIKPGPREVGFDHSFIIPATADRTPCVFIEDGRVVGLDPKDPIQVSYKEKVGKDPTGREHPELLTKQKPSAGHDGTIVNGISRIGFMTGGQKARWKDEDIADTITRRAVAFIERNQARPFFLYFPTSDVHVPRFPHPRFRGQNEHGLRGAAIVQLDWCVGELLKALDKFHLADNTLVIFTSDNGGVMDDGYRDGSGSDTSGHKCNGPLRGYKGSSYEGGSRIPFIVRWPGRAPAGKTSDSLVSLIDLLATCAAIVHSPMPANAGPDSVNILPALLAVRPEKPCRETLVTQGRGLNIRRGKWKLIPGAARVRAYGQAKAQRRPAELYDLEADPYETKNLATKRPETVKELAGLLREIRQSGRERPAAN